MQNSVRIQIYYTEKYDVEGCNEDGVELLGDLEVEVEPSLEFQPIFFSLAFGKEEIKATEFVEGKTAHSTFKLDLQYKEVGG